MQNRNRFKGKTIVDLPAGNGVTSKIIQEIGATPLPFDLFPEYFTLQNVKCQRANVLEGIPLESSSSDAVICQEGIEHFTDQFQVMKEFNRILKKNGSLIITTPNYSNLRARMSYFLSESERFHTLMPPNEIDSVWMSDKKITGEIYFGHVFLVGVQKLRVLAKLSGFNIKHIQFTRTGSTSLVIFIFTYPLIFLSNCISYLKNIRKKKGYDSGFQKRVYKEIFKLNINPKILLDTHLFVEFTKEKNSDEVLDELKSVHENFEVRT